MSIYRFYWEVNSKSYAIEEREAPPINGSRHTLKYIVDHSNFTQYSSSMDTSKVLNEDKILLEEKREHSAYLKTYKKYQDIHKEYPDLFLKFADLSLNSDEDILEFAKKYGLLDTFSHWMASNSASGLGQRLRYPISKSVGYSLYAEPLYKWNFEIRNIKSTIRLWNAIKAQDIDLLQEFISWRNGNSVHYEDEYEKSWIATDKYQQWFLKKVKVDDYVTPALFKVQKTINKRLQNLLSPQLTFDADLSTSPLQLTPKSLIGVIWYQLSQEVSGIKEIKTCENCGDTIVITRRDKRFCKPACRQDAYRKRKNEDL